MCIRDSSKTVVLAVCSSDLPLTSTSTIYTPLYSTYYPRRQTAHPFSSHNPILSVREYLHQVPDGIQTDVKSCILLLEKVDSSESALGCERDEFVGLPLIGGQHLTTLEVPAQPKSTIVTPKGVHFVAPCKTVQVEKENRSKINKLTVPNRYPYYGPLSSSPHTNLK